MRQRKPVTIRNVRYGSMTEAARQLGTSPACVSAASRRGTLDFVGLGMRRGGRKWQSDHPLAAWLKNNGITLEEFGVMVGRSGRHLGFMARGQRRPTDELAERIAKATRGEVPIDVWF